MKLTLRDSLSPDAPEKRLEAEKRDSKVEVRLDGKLYILEEVALRDGVLSGVLKGRPFRALTSSQPPPPGTPAGAGGTRHISLGSHQASFQIQKGNAARARARSDAHDNAALTSTMPGQVLKVLVQEGDVVQKHQALLIIEAMKMEHEVKAPHPGKVRKITCTAGSMVSPGVPLVELEAVPDPS